MWLFVLYVLTAFLGLHFAVVAERTAHNLQCLPSQLPAVTHCDSVCWHLCFYIFLAGFFFFGSYLHFQCVCTTVKFRSPGTERFMVNTLQKAEPGPSDVLFLLNKNFEWPQASGLHSYPPAFSFVLVTWYFMALSVVFTETTRPYSLDFMGLHWRFSRCVDFPFSIYLCGISSKLLISEVLCGITFSTPV